MMDADAAFVSDGESSEAIDPGKAAFNDPSAAAAFLQGFRTARGDAGRNVTVFAGIAAAPVRPRAS
jgi:hypothetical protein